MASNYTFLDNNGIVVADTADIKETVQNEFLAALGSDLSLEDSTPQGRLIDIETNCRTAVINNNVAVANSINFNLSNGITLDAWGANFDLERDPATSSSVIATVTGVAGTVISSGSTAQTQNGDLFYAENNITIPQSGSITATFLSVEKGEIPCPIGSLTKIIDGTLGWETITNLAPATLGTLQQSDASYKQEFYDNGLFSGMSLIEDYDNALMRVDNVISARVIENGLSTTKVVDNITLLPHSVYACVDGGNDTDVANALFYRKSAGSNWTGLTGQTVTVDVVEPTYGDTYQVIFNRPNEIQIYATVSASAGTATSTNLADDIKTAISNYINTHKIGESVSILQLAQAINSAIPGIALNSIAIGTSSGSQSTANITIHVNQVAKVSAENITVTINA